MSIGVSDKFKAAYTQPHSVVASGFLQDRDSGSVIQNLAFSLTGRNEVTIDATSANRRTLACELLDVPAGSLLPVDAKSLLAPISNEIVVSRGIQYADGTSELCQLGVFGIFTAQEVRTPAGPGIEVMAYDRSKRLDVNFSQDHSFAKNTPFDTIITTLMDASGVIFPKHFDPSVHATLSPAVVFRTSDKIWEQVQKIATALGCWAYFDVYGVFQMVPVPDTVNASVAWSYVEGADCTFDATDRTLETEDGSAKSYSRTIVISSVHASGAHPIRADAYDLDPDSPTYYLGKFGNRPYVDGNVSQFVSTLAQAQAVANALGRMYFGLLERVHFSAAPNPALDAGDVLLVTDAETHTNNTYVLESFNMPLFAAGGASTATLRTKQTSTGN